MTDNSLITRTYQALRQQFGHLVCVAEKPSEPATIFFPGLDAPVHIWAHPEQGILQIGCPVAETCDWSLDGLSEFLLAETSTYVFGRLERCADGIAIEHNVFADGDAQELRTVVLALANTAARLKADLREMGALTTPDFDEDC